ncbi:MAG: hypothetical protein LC800_03070 [Acidobacteria bacterium]|nr:hypothetical protein [Acidobacteriota bacterium]
MSAHTAQPDLSEIIAENFGPNATYVEGLLQRFRSDPALVDEAWRAYFTELTGGTPAPQAAGNGGAAATRRSPRPPRRPPPRPRPPRRPPCSPPRSPQPGPSAARP